ncbi:MAG: CBS domain-containing protein [Candidatus Hadarchaeales archaeon]
MRSPGVSLGGLTAREVMVKTFPSVGSRDLVTKARAIMRETGWRILPVVDGGMLEGIITQREILRVSSTRSNIPVSGIMSIVPVLITPATELKRVVKALIDFGLDGLPVVMDQTNRTIVGMIRAEDIVQRLVELSSLKVKVEDIMTRDPVVCSPEDEIVKIWEIMEKSHFSGVPVVEVRGGKKIVIGIITRSDIIREGSARLSEESRKERKTKVRSVMKSPAVTIEQDSEVVQAMRLMLERKIKRLPVVKNGELVGIVSREDILKMICR